MVTGHSPDDAHVDFKMVNATFHNGSGLIKRNKSKNLSKRGVNLLTDGFNEINHMLKHQFNVFGKAQVKAYIKRVSGDFGAV